jgi:hypothetical protein
MAAEMNWKDISDYRETKDLLYITLGVLIVDVFVIFLSRYLPGLFGCALNAWYTEFGFMAVVADVGIIVIGFLIARYLYTKFFEKKYDWNPLVFVGLLILVQAIHDIIFYLGVIVPIPRGHNAMMDIFKDYSEGGAKILVGDSVLMVLSAITAMILKGQEDYSVGAIGISVLYAMSYILYTKPVGGVCVR